MVAVDASAQMLEQARRRARSAGWTNVRLIDADAAAMDANVPDMASGFDAVISTYALSLMPDWPRALSTMVAVTRPGGTVAVVDMQRPVGRARLWSPLAQLACLLGGSDIDAHPWVPMESALVDVRRRSLRGAHIQIRVGSVPTCMTDAYSTGR